MALTRCPNCGVNVYEPEDSLPPQNETLTNIQNALRRPFAIFVGWFITAFVGLLIYLPIRFAITESPTEVFVVLLATSTLSVGGFAGGFIYQRISQEKNNFGNLSQILFSVFLGSLVLLTEGGSRFLWLIPSVLGLLVMGVASFFGIRVADKMLRQAMIDDLFAPVVESQKRYQELLTKVGHDRTVAERLIEHERQLAPKATRYKLIENAIKRWNRDNRIV
jgi:Zn-dependent protease with chaperone function